MSNADDTDLNNLLQWYNKWLLPFNPFLPKYLVRTASLWTELITKITPLWNRLNWSFHAKLTIDYIKRYNS